MAHALAKRSAREKRRACAAAIKGCNGNNAVTRKLGVFALAIMLRAILVHAGKFGVHLEGVLCFSHVDCRRPGPNVGRGQILIESTKRILHFAPHGTERIPRHLLARGPQSWKIHLFTPSQVRENLKGLLCFCPFTINI